MSEISACVSFNIAAVNKWPKFVWPFKTEERPPSNLIAVVPITSSKIDFWLFFILSMTDLTSVSSSHFSSCFIEIWCGTNLIISSAIKSYWIVTTPTFLKCSPVDVNMVPFTISYWFNSEWLWPSIIKSISSNWLAIVVDLILLSVSIPICIRPIITSTPLSCNTWTINLASATISSSVPNVKPTTFSGFVLVTVSGVVSPNNPTLIPPISLTKQSP